MSWVYGDGYVYTYEELVRQLIEDHGYNWHFRLDGKAVLAKAPWKGGMVLAEYVPNVEGMRGELDGD